MISKDKIGRSHGDFLNAVKNVPLIGDAFRLKNHSDGLPTLECRTFEALIRAVGFYKYRSPGVVLFRGQRACTNNLSPGLYRSPPVGVDFDRLMDEFLDHYRAAVGVDPKDTQRVTTEALLQHYGLRTRWLDFVDSVPHALFFATHDFVESPLKSGMKTYIPSIDEWSYVYLIEVSGLEPLVSGETGEKAPGIWWAASRARVCDLRQAKPSHALRPHAQHGMLVRPPPGSQSLCDHVVARLAVRVRDARTWLGNGFGTCREGLFPPTRWDAVYGTLLAAPAQTAISSFVEAKPAAVWFGGIAKFDFIEEIP